MKIFFKDTSKFSDNTSHLYEHVAVLFYSDKYPDAAVGAVTYDFGMFIKVSAPRSKVRKQKVIDGKIDRYLDIALRQMELEDWGRYSIPNRQALLGELRRIDAIKWQDFSDVSLYAKKHNIQPKNDKLLKFVDADDDFRDVEISIAIPHNTKRGMMVLEAIKDCVSSIIGRKIHENFYVRWTDKSCVKDKYIFSWLISCEKNSSRNAIADVVHGAIETSRSAESSQIIMQYIKTAAQKQQWQSDFLELSMNSTRMIAGSKEIIKLASDYILNEKLFRDYSVDIVFKHLPK